MGALGGDRPTDDRDGTALETDLAGNILGVETEDGEDGGARSGVRLGTKEGQRSTHLSGRIERIPTSSELLQHRMLPVLQESTPPASARSGKTKREATAATRAIIVNVVDEYSAEGVRCCSARGARLRADVSLFNLEGFIPPDDGLCADLPADKVRRKCAKNN